MSRFDAKDSVVAGGVTSTLERSRPKGVTGVLPHIARCRLICDRRSMEEQQGVSPWRQLEVLTTRRSRREEGASAARIAAIARALAATI